jgi:iron(III) transport system permease protein
VIAIGGVLLPLAAIDRTVDGWARAWFGGSTGLLLSGTLIALLFAYLRPVPASGAAPASKPD